mmetsp:Transcript_7797/g.22252  ORF Transcript_7797/g.22252 Transcript_7797/m.22252 type:complete len:289 (+) Transcript_7797:1071-1937(+)
MVDTSASSSGNFLSSSVSLPCALHSDCFFRISFNNSVQAVRFSLNQSQGVMLSTTVSARLFTDHLLRWSSASVFGRHSKSTRAKPSSADGSVNVLYEALRMLSAMSGRPFGCVTYQTSGPTSGSGMAAAAPPSSSSAPSSVFCFFVAGSTALSSALSSSSSSLTSSFFVALSFPAFARRAALMASCFAFCFAARSTPACFRRSSSCNLSLCLVTMRLWTHSLCSGAGSPTATFATTSKWGAEKDLTVSCRSLLAKFDFNSATMKLRLENCATVLIILFALRLSMPCTP